MMSLWGCGERGALSTSPQAGRGSGSGGQFPVIAQVSLDVIGQAVGAWETASRPSGYSWTRTVQSLGDGQGAGPSSRSALRHGHSPSRTAALDHSREHRIPFTLYADDFQSFATHSFSTILSASRKWGLSPCLANQYLTQPPAGLQQAVLGNIGTLIVFRVASQDAALLAGEVGIEPANARYVRPKEELERQVERIFR